MTIGKPKLAINNIYIIAQFLIISYLYTLLITNKKIIYIFVIIFICFFIINNLFIQPIHTFQSWTRFAGAIIMICYSSLFYRQFLKTTPPIDPIYQHYSFWLNTAIFFYFSFSLLLFAMVNYIFTKMSTETGMLAWSFHNFNNVIKNILFAVTIGFAGRQK